jgi:hypothetical protein
MISSLPQASDAQAMPEHQEQQATVAHLVPAALGRFNQPFNLAAGEVFSHLPADPGPVRERAFSTCNTPLARRLLLSGDRRMNRSLVCFTGASALRLIGIHGTRVLEPTKSVYLSQVFQAATGPIQCAKTTAF